MFRIKDGISLAGSIVLDSGANYYATTYTATTATIGDTVGSASFPLVLNSSTSTSSPPTQHKLLVLQSRETAGTTSAGTYDEIGRYLGGTVQSSIRLRNNDSALSDAYKFPISLTVGGTPAVNIDTSGNLIIGNPTSYTAANPTDVKLHIMGSGSGGRLWLNDSATTIAYSKMVQLSWADGALRFSADHYNTSVGNTKITFATDGDQERAYIDSTGIGTSLQLTSSVATGTAPLVITSTTLVSNLNADLLDGNHASAFATSGHTHSGYLPTSGNTTYSGGILTVQNDNSIDVTTTGSINGLQVYQGVAGADALMTFHIGGDFALHFGLDGETNDLTVGGWSMGAAKYKIWHAGNDGSGSGLDADTLDGNHASAFAASSHTHSYLSPTSAARPGVTKLYRRDDDSDYNVQTYWTGSYWHLDGYNGDTYHAGCQVAYSDASGYATYLSNGTNSATLTANTTSSYGAWNVGGSRNGWYGFYFAVGNTPHIMFDGSGNGGMYHETGGRWPLYYNYANNCMGVCTSATNSSMRMYVAGSVYSTGSVYAASDERIKKEIKPIENAVDSITKLRGVSYVKLQDKDEVNYAEKREIGVIAQEVLPHVPELVNYDEENDRYSVSYANFAGLFIEAIKEQQKMIDDLKKEIEILKGER